MRLIGSFVVVGAVLSGISQAAQPPPPSPPACTGAEYRQFDFWAGDWRVTTEDGKTMLGDSHVVPILEGCVLHEHWRGAKGGQGESFNIWDSGSGHWQQDWVDRTGGTLRLDGGVKDGAMVLSGRHQVGGKDQVERITWKPLPDGRVNQRWETSTDDGATWTISFDGYYRKVPRGKRS